MTQFGETLRLRPTAYPLSLAAYQRTPWLKCHDSSTVWVSRSPKAQARAASSPLGRLRDGLFALRHCRRRARVGAVRPLHRPLAAGGPCRERPMRRRDPEPDLRRHRDEGGEGGHYFCETP